VGRNVWFSSDVLGRIASTPGGGPRVIGGGVDRQASDSLEGPECGLDRTDAIASKLPLDAGEANKVACQLPDLSPCGPHD
jgi:hypothetical protein